MKKSKWHILTVLVLLLAGWYGYETGIIITEGLEEEEQTELSSIPYANYFRQYAPQIGWDWQLLAAVCWEESHFNPRAQSYVGAKGLMQLMPKTSRRFMLNDSTIWEPEDNIRAGVEYIARLQDIYSFITSPDENRNFVLASYNAGPAHIMDARRLAKRYGRNPYVWFDNTEYWLIQLQDPEVATDSVVQYGSFNATETVAYVKKVLRTYKKFLSAD